MPLTTFSPPTTWRTTHAHPENRTDGRGGRPHPGPVRLWRQLRTDGGHGPLVRRQVPPAEGRTVREPAFYRCIGSADTSLRELIRVAGARRAIEERFETAKHEAGLDHYQVRTWRAWSAHITLSMLAPAYLAVTRAREQQRDRELAHAPTSEKGEPTPAANG